MQNRLPEWCFRLGIVYLVMGMTVGAYMGMKEDFSLKDAHAHFNLLGFAVTFLMGLFLKTYPATVKDAFSRRVVIAALVAVPVMLALLLVFTMGVAALGPALGIASLVVWFIYILFAVVVWRATAAK